MLHRLTDPNAGKLSAYFGLTPTVEESGNYQGPSALKRHGRGAIRQVHGSINEAHGRRVAAELCLAQDPGNHQHVNASADHFQNDDAKERRCLSQR